MKRLFGDFRAEYFRGEMTLLRNACRILNGLLLFSLLFLPALVFAQTSGPSLRGQVLDPSGAAVPALTVTVVGPTGTKLVAQTDEQGKYAFRNLAPGTYTLTISLKGFNDFVKPASSSPVASRRW